MFFYVFTAITSFAGQIYGVVYNLFLRQNGLTNLDIGKITSAGLWGSAVLGTFFAFVMNKFEKRRFFESLLLIQILVQFLRIFLTDPQTQIVLNFLSGASSSAISIMISASMIVSTPSRDRIVLFGSNFSISMITSVIGNLVGGTIADMTGFRFTMLIANATYGTSLFVVKKLPISSRQNIEKVTFTKVQKDIFWYYLFSNLLVGFGAGLFISFGNLILNDLFAMSTTLIGTVMALTQIATGVGGGINHILEKRFGSTRVLLFCYSLVVPLMISLAFVRSPVVFSSLYVFRFMLMNMVNPIFSVLIFSNLPVQYLPVTNGIGNLLNSSSRAVAALLYGYIVNDSSDYTKLLLLSTVFYSMNALLTYSLHRKISFFK
ncbi:MAG: MFS transporter, partial [Pseudothermotoga sp.]